MRESILDIVHVGIALVELVRLSAPGYNHLLEIDRPALALDGDPPLVHVDVLDISADDVNVRAVEVVVFNKEALVL